VSNDPRIDAYIAKVGEFARPILQRVRERVHAVLPEVEETIKWGHPTYCKDGKILLGTAAFKAHASVHFWNAGGFEQAEGMGQLGKLTSVNDLPADLDALIGRAVERAAAPAPKKPKAAPKPVGDPHPDLVSALDANPAARATFEAFAPSHKRDYVEWVNEAKQDATRARRIAQAVEWMAEGKRRNWKYENC